VPPEVNCDALLGLVEAAGRLCVLTGAGCSTSAGIPDYRDEQGRWKRTAPILYHDFVTNARVRRSYWARSLLGWPFFAAAQPTDAHRALAALEARGRVRQIITQNVDGLHQRAGSTAVIDLHGRLDAVRCLDCGASASRSSLQQQLLARNPAWRGKSAAPGPDGDALLENNGLELLALVPCGRCGGILKPDVVFFGESVPSERVARCREAIRSCDALLVVGTSLSALSGFRFVREAHRLDVPVAAINLGRTRADDLFTLKVRAAADTALSALALASRDLGAATRSSPSLGGDYRFS